MEEQGCPLCKTTKYRNPSLKLLVNVCGHSLCDNCVEMLFIKGSGACPQCGTGLRRNNYRLQVFEDAFVEKEVDIRKKILKDFNKKEEDFSSLREYNDYLEMVETIIFNLAHGVDVESTRKMIDQYRKENKELIKKNQLKLSKDEQYLEELISQQLHEAASRNLLTEAEQKEKARKRKDKEDLIDELMFSDMPAESILATHFQSCSEKDSGESKSSSGTTFSTGIRLGHQSTFGASSQAVETKAYVYQPLEEYSNGPRYISMDSILQEGYLSNIRASSEAELAGGFEPQIACQRALHDAMCGLFYFPVQQPSSTTPSTSSHFKSPMGVS